MPVEMKMWRIDGDQPRTLSAAALPTERELHNFLLRDPSLLGIRLLVIGSEVRTPYGKRLDLLAIDADGNLHVLELKRDRTPREVVAQILDYGSWVSTLSHEDVKEIADKHLDALPFEAAFEEVFGGAPPDELNGELQLTVVAAELDSSSERIVSYLRDFGVPVNAVFFSYLEDDGRRYLARSWLVDDHAPQPVPNKKRAAWNGRDWYVNFGTDGRDWSDGQEFGFVSAGGGAVYSKVLRQIKEGDRINVYVPGRGYVGIGVSVGEARPFAVAHVRQGDAWTPLAAQSLRGTYRNALPDEEETDDIAEWVVPVRWVRTVPVEQAFKESGLFYNPNTVCKLRQEFTLSRLSEHFGLDGDA